jgi:glycosyltransferase involved in cell wall biosynthesis
VFLDSLTSGFTDLYLSNSEAGSAAIHRREGIPHSKIFTIQNGVDLAMFDPETCNAQGTADTYKRMFGIAQTERVIGIVATLNSIKAHKTLVDALPRIREHIPEVRCVFAGRDDLDGHIQRYVHEKQLEDTVIFTGCRQDVPQILSMFEVFLLPSLWEGLPVSILEAMAMKKPVIATSVGGIPELVDHKKTGILIPPGDPEALADAVIFLLDNPAIAANMGSAGYERVQQEFSIQTLVAKTEAVYEQLIERRFKVHTTKGMLL